MVSRYASSPRASHRNESQPPSSKKTKKSSVSKHSAAHVLDPDDAAALNRRAVRFQHENDIEYQKRSRPFGTHPFSSHSPYDNSQLFNKHASARRLRTTRTTPTRIRCVPRPSPALPAPRLPLVSNPALRGIERAKFGPLHHRRNIAGDTQGLPAAQLGTLSPRPSAYALGRRLTLPLPPPPSQEPKQEQIRPYHVLQDTLNQLKKRWREKAAYN